jgi:hypothetical protein
MSVFVGNINLVKQLAAVKFEDRIGRRRMATRRTSRQLKRQGRHYGYESYGRILRQCPNEVAHVQYQVSQHDDLS